MNTCVICDKKFEPRYNTPNQKCCSDACRKAHHNNYYLSYRDTERYQRACINSKLKYRENSIVKCKICGKRVIHEFNEMNSSTSQMHRDCILDEAETILRRGEKLDHKTYLRLYATGYTLKEFKHERNI